MGLAEADDPLRQPVGGDRLAGMDRHHAALEAGEIVERLNGEAGARQHLPRLRQEGAAGLGELGCRGRPGRRVLWCHTRLERGNGRARRRLGDPQRLGSARDMGSSPATATKILSCSRVTTSFRPIGYPDWNA